MKTLSKQETANVAGGMDANAINVLFEGLVAMGFVAGFAVCALGFAGSAGYQYYKSNALQDAKHQ